MRFFPRIFSILLLLAVVVSACGSPPPDPQETPAVTNSPLPPSDTPTPQPSATPEPPSPTPTATPDPFADYFGLLAVYLESKHDIDVLSYNHEDSTLQLMILTSKETEDTLNNLSWRLINDIAFLLQDLDPEGLQVEGMFGTGSYTINLRVFALEEAFFVNSLTDQELLSAISAGEVNQVEWWELSELAPEYP